MLAWFLPGHSDSPRSDLGPAVGSYIGKSAAIVNEARPRAAAERKGDPRVSGQVVGLSETDPLRAKLTPSQTM
jgi:hypothetical protein